MCNLSVICSANGILDKYLYEINGFCRYGWMKSFWDHDCFKLMPRECCFYFTGSDMMSCAFSDPSNKKGGDLNYTICHDVGTTSSALPMDKGLQLAEGMTYCHVDRDASLSVHILLLHHYRSDFAHLSDLYILVIGLYKSES